MIDGSIDGMAYVTHSVTGIDYPMRSGKIYLESTTAKDTKDMTLANAQIYGFDNIVAKNVMQCDSLPELTDVLTEHGWKITNNKDEADYQVSISTVYCGYADTWLKKSNREQKLSDRDYYKQYKAYLESRGFTLTPEEALRGKGKMIELAAEKFDISKFKHYFNVFDYKYEGAPQYIKDLANANANHAYQKLGNANTAAADGIRAGANAAGMGNSKAGLAFAAIGLLMGAGGPPTYKVVAKELL